MSSQAAPRVLVVDDSAFVRKVLTELLRIGRCEVIGTARDGIEALEKVHQLEPDVVTLDLMMPHLDGLGFLDALAGVERPPAVVVVSVSGSDTEAGVVALQRGAVAVVEKPTALATRRLYELEDDLVEQVKVAAAAHPRVGLDRKGSAAAVRPPEPQRVLRTDLVAVGTSTGGPHALTQLLAALPAAFPVPLAIVLHIPVGYTAPLAERLDRASPLHVVEASEGRLFEPGMAVLARAGVHLKVLRDARGLVAHLDVHPTPALHTPSVDVLFESAADACGPRALGVVLTGMGEDGLAGARRIRRKGGRLLVESETSAVVWGMPRAVWEDDLALARASLEDLPELIVDTL